jgi:hypothetical protein
MPLCAADRAAVVNDDLVLAIDAGTTSVRAALVRVGDGEVVSTAAFEVKTNCPSSGFAEQKPSDWKVGLQSGLFVCTLSLCSYPSYFFGSCSIPRVTATRKAVL